MWFFKKRGRREKKDRLDLNALNELRKIKSKKFSRYSLENLNRVFRIYLREKYRLKQSLTFEELTKKIKRRKIDKMLKQKIMFLAAEINSIEYNFSRADRKKFNSLINELKAIINYR